MLEHHLAELGLTKHDIAVYLCVLKHKRILPALVARETGINRSTVYSVLKSLGKRGLIYEDLGGKSAYVMALPPEHLQNLTRTARLALARKERLIKHAAEELAAIAGSEALPIPKIRYVEEDDLDDFMRSRMARWHASAIKHDSTWWGFQDHSYVEHYERTIDYGWDIADLGIQVKLFTNDADVERSMRKKKYATQRVMRSLGPDAPFTASVEIAGDYTIMISTRTRPHYLIELHDPLLAENHRTFFRLMWERG